MIKEIIITNPTLTPQNGKVVEFKRRTPEQSLIPENANLKGVYNHIRMLDAQTYPKAYINYGNIRITFDKAILSNNHINANAKIEIVYE